jgi:hypothetical protein
MLMFNQAMLNQRAAQGGVSMIDPSVIYLKTVKGEEAVRDRKSDLPADIRMVLLLVNGQRNVAALQAVSEGLQESIAPLLFLEDNGYIALSGAQTNVLSFPGNAAAAPAQAYATAAHPAPVAAVAPLVAAPPVMAQPAPAMAAAPAEDRAALQNKLSALSAYIVSTLGEDAEGVLKRIREVQTQGEYVALLRKLYDILRDYRGVREAEKFMQSFVQQA